MGKLTVMNFMMVRYTVISGRFVNIYIYNINIIYIIYKILIPHA